MTPRQPEPRPALPQRKMIHYEPAWHETARSPSLRFTPDAWAKLEYLCHAGPTEISGFAVVPTNDLLLVERFVLIRQRASFAHVVFYDDAVANYMDAQIDAGLRPEQCMRIWCHTHPGNSPEPSGHDEQTFKRVFGKCDWAIMFILARNGATYARLRFNVGPGGELLIPVGVDYGVPFSGSDRSAWHDEYVANVENIENRTSIVWDDFDDREPPTPRAAGIDTEMRQI